MAQEALEKAVSLSESPAVARQDLVSACFAAGEWQGAIEQGQQLLKEGEEGASVAWLLRILSYCHSELGDGRKAVEHLEEVCRMEPGDATDHYNLASEHRRLGNLEAALTEVRRAIGLAPDDQGIALLLGQLLVETGEWAEAERVQQRLREGTANTDAAPPA